MPRILKYILLTGISFLLTLPVFSQGDSLRMRQGGVQLGVDLVPAIGYFLSSPRRGAALMTDVEFRDGWFITAEGGYLDFTKEETDYRYMNNGMYFKAGINHNFIPRLPQENDIVFWGLRVATGSFTHSVDPVVIRSGYWGNYTTSLPEERVHPFWAEMVLGIKVEMLRNFFVGWNVRGRFQLHLPHSNFPPYIVPGYGYAGKSFSIGFNYTLAYRIPYKIKVIEKKKKKTEEEEEK